MIKNLKILIAGFALLSQSALCFEETRMEENPENNYTSPAVTLFLNNLKAPVIRVVPDGNVWVEFPENIATCDTKSAHIELDWLNKAKREDSESIKNPKVLRITSSVSQLSDQIKERLVTNPETVPDTQLLCVIGDGKQALVFLRISNDPHFIVKLSIKKKVSLDDLVFNESKISPQTMPSSEKNEVKFIQASTEKNKKDKNTKDFYELEFYRPIKKYNSSELKKLLEKKGDI